MASPEGGCAFPVTVTHLVPSHLIVMRPVSVGVSRASLDLNVTGAHEGSSTSRREAAHVSIDSRAKGRQNVVIRTEISSQVFQCD